MSFEAASEALRTRVSSARIGVEALVTMGRLRAINVLLAGEVRIPGARSLSALSRVTHALFASGGLSEVGSLRAIEVKRGGETIARFDAYDLMLAGDSRGDVQLRDGDVVFVPPLAKLAGVSGAVRRPGVFELTQGESLADLWPWPADPRRGGVARGCSLSESDPAGVQRFCSLIRAILRSLLPKGGTGFVSRSPLSVSPTGLCLRAQCSVPGSMATSPACALAMC